MKSKRAGNGDVYGRRVRVEQGIYRQPNEKYAVCFMVDGKPTFRTVGYELDAERRERRTFVEAAHHLPPAFGSRLLREITVHDIAEQLVLLREQGRAENTIAGALATPQCVLRFALAG